LASSNLLAGMKKASFGSSKGSSLWMPYASEYLEMYQGAPLSPCSDMFDPSFSIRTKPPAPRPLQLRFVTYPHVR
jgi:hypothetical protein